MKSSMLMRLSVAGGAAGAVVAAGATVEPAAGAAGWFG